MKAKMKADRLARLPWGGSTAGGGVAVNVGGAGGPDAGSADGPDVCQAGSRYGRTGGDNGGKAVDGGEAVDDV
jgi:hypothetical protein